MENKYKASWDFLLFIMSSLFVVIILLPLFLFPAYFNVLVSIILLLISSLFIITGYSIKNNNLIIHRIFWKKTYDLSELKSIEINISAMDNSWRLFGIGGVFSYSGIFSNKFLGKYKAYATNRKNSVILYFSNQVVVVTPDTPNNFVNAIKSIHSNLKMV